VEGADQRQHARLVLMVVSSYMMQYRLQAKRPIVALGLDFLSCGVFGAWLRSARQ